MARAEFVDEAHPGDELEHALGKDERRVGGNRAVRLDIDLCGDSQRLLPGRVVPAREVADKGIAELVLVEIEGAQV